MNQSKLSAIGGPWKRVEGVVRQGRKQAKSAPETGRSAG